MTERRRNRRNDNGHLKMIWHITKRELYDNLNSLQFALATFLLLGLMLTNAVVHLREHPERVQKYREDVDAYQNRLKSYAEESLYRLAQKGPGDLYKKPSPLHFCAGRADAFLSAHVSGNTQAWSVGGLVDFWTLGYPSANPNWNNLDPDVTKVDWGFIIGYVLSLLALLFTFDSISSERESGTLRLMLANAIPRHTVLIGKFLGALISIGIPFTLTVLVNLLVISTSSDVYLSADTWERLGMIYFIALLYTCLFLALGLLVSARVKRSAVSLVILLLAWVTLIVFMPSALASIAGFSSSPKADLRFGERASKLYEELKEEYDARLYEAGEDRGKQLQLSGEYVTKDAEQQKRLHEGRLKQRVSQVNRARTITHLSPVAIVEHLLESFAGTGFERHLQFLENVQSYERQFREFIVDTDRADPASLHIFGVSEGMSQKFVPPEAVPKFEDTHNFRLDFNTAAMNLLLLTLFFVVFFSGASLAFVRVEI